MPTPRTFEVPGVTCDHCKRAIEGEINELDGITAVEVDIDNKLVTVDGAADDQAIIGAIEEAGYEVASAGPAASGAQS